MLTQQLADAINMTLFSEARVTITTVLDTTTTNVKICKIRIASLNNNETVMETNRAHITERLGVEEWHTRPIEKGTEKFEHLSELMSGPRYVDLPQVSVVIGEDLPMAHHILYSRQDTERIHTWNSTAYGPHSDGVWLG
jgi:hypothetical protein